MFYIQKDSSRVNDQLKQSLIKISDFDKPINIMSTKSDISRQSSHKGKRVDNSKDFIFTKTQELNTKQLELDLLKQKIDQVTLLKTMKVNDKTPYFKNSGTPFIYLWLLNGLYIFIATLTGPLNFQIRTSSDIFERDSNANLKTVRNPSLKLKSNSLYGTHQNKS